MVSNDVPLLTLMSGYPIPLISTAKLKKFQIFDKNTYFVYIFVVGDTVATD